MMNDKDGNTSTGSLLRSLLDGSFDAGVLVDGSESSNGRILYLNEAALDLFECKRRHDDGDNDNDTESNIADSEQNDYQTIGEFVSFWSPTVSIFSTTDDDDDTPRSGRSTRSKTRDGSERDGDDNPDQLSWSQVVAAASQSIDPVRTWMITGTKMTTTICTSPSSNSLAKKEGEQAPTKKAVKSTRTTFPGVFQLTNLPTNDGSKVWLAYIRHSDHHDIIKTGSVSYGDTSASRPRVLRGSRRQSDLPRITIDESGTIIDIHNPGKEDAFNWIQSDLIGSHMSEAKSKQELQQTPESSMPSNGDKQASQKFPTVKSKKTAMLDLILDNHMDAGHPSCPYSGLTLHANDYNTALTTGNAIREENITGTYN